MQVIHESFLKETVPRDFQLQFFHELVSPKPLSITLGPFRFFGKFTEILPAQSVPPVSTTPVANWKTLIRKVLIILFGHLWVPDLTYRYIFSFKFSRCRWYRWQFGPSVDDTCGKFAACRVDTGGKFANGIIDTSGNSGIFAAGVVDSGGLCSWHQRQNFHDDIYFILHLRLLL